MNAKPINIFQYDDPRFDLFRLSKSKETVDICSNTLRAYHRLGLPFYRRGKAVFISRTDLVNFIQAKQQQQESPLMGDVPPEANTNASTKEVGRE